MISKQDLFYLGYSWNQEKEDTEHAIAFSTTDTLNKTEGYEVLEFINSFCEKYRFRDKTKAIKIEHMIRNNVPAHINKPIDVENWIMNNWSKIQI